MTHGDTRAWTRRARPLLGTLVEVGAPDEEGSAAAVEAAFGAIGDVQACLSRFDGASDIARFNALRSGTRLRVRALTQDVLQAAAALQAASAGRFDISLGSGPEHWALRGDELHKLDDAVRLDLGGIGKGHAVDVAVRALVAHGVTAGWVNAGGDLRAFGEIDAPVRLRDESTGGVRSFATLRDGAIATSCFGAGTRSALAGGDCAHVSVAAPLCLWADALTKVVAISRDANDPLLGRFDARAWLH